MARLAELRLAMGTSISLVTLIFAVFLSAIMLIFNFQLAYAAIGTAIFILLQYLIGPAVVESSTKLRYLKLGENPWLESIVKELAGKDGIPMPRLAIVPDNTPNAFVFGRTARSATLVVHEGLLMKLNEDEIKGVIGHELGHIKHKDYVVMTVLSALPLLAYLIAKEAAIKMLKQAKKAAPALFENAGPTCVELGYCPEGKMKPSECSIEEIKKHFISL